MEGDKTWREAQSLYSDIYPTRCNFTQFIYIWKLIYMFGVVPLPIIRSAYNCIYSIWYLSYYCCVYSEKLLMLDRGTVRNM